MKKLFAITVGFFFAYNVHSQGDRCNTYVDYSWLQSNAFARYQRFIDLDNFTNNYISNQTQTSARLINGSGLIVIPVVVHVIHRGESEGTGYNISLATIQSQIDVLNEDFRRLNADAINTPLTFQPLASDFGIEFRLACIDPNGNPTNGVVRKYTNVQEFNSSFVRQDGTIDDDLVGVKLGLNGSVAWNTAHYLNIWVCNLDDAGYATWPADYLIYPQFDGVVIDKEAFGRIGGTLSGYNKGRTATHEIGHWLNLRHLWGNLPRFQDNGNCQFDDLVGDTPQQMFSSTTPQNGGCPSFPDIERRCNTADISTMFMNYMDYVKDDCYNMFSNGQKLRARAVFAVGGVREQQLNNWFKVRQAATPIWCEGEVYSSPICLPTTWTVLSGPATLTPVAGTNKATISASGVGTVRIRAVSGNYITEDDIQVSNLAPVQPGSIDVTLIDLQLGRIEVAIDEVPNANSYNWYKNGVLVTDFHVNWGKVPIPRGVCDLDYGISVEAVNGCGASPAQFEVVYVPCEDYFMISPNPASSSVIVVLAEKNTGSGSKKSITEVKIYDQQGNVKKNVRFGNVKQASVNINELNSGVYFIEIISASYKERKQLLINR